MDLGLLRQRQVAPGQDAAGPVDGRHLPRRRHRAQPAPPAGGDPREAEGAVHLGAPRGRPARRRRQAGRWGRRQGPVGPAGPALQVPGPAGTVQPGALRPVVPRRGAAGRVENRTCVPRAHARQGTGPHVRLPPPGRRAPDAAPRPGELGGRRPPDPEEPVPPGHRRQQRRVDPNHRVGPGPGRPPATDTGGPGRGAAVHRQRLRQGLPGPGDHRDPLQALPGAAAFRGHGAVGPVRHRHADQADRALPRQGDPGRLGRRERHPPDHPGQEAQRPAPDRAGLAHPPGRDLPPPARHQAGARHRRRGVADRRLPAAARAPALLGAGPAQHRHHRH